MGQRAYRPPIQEVPPQKPSDTGLKTDVSYQGYQILHVGFAALPLVVGTDKFFHLLANWDQYLAPLVPRVTGISSHTFMLIVGGIEIVAGIGVAVKPKYFSYVVSAWLAGIVTNLLILGNFYDIALRDFGLFLGALALGRLSSRYDIRGMRAD